MKDRAAKFCKTVQLRPTPGQRKQLAELAEHMFRRYCLSRLPSNTAVLSYALNLACKTAARADRNLPESQKNT